MALMIDETTKAKQAPTQAQVNALLDSINKQMTDVNNANNASIAKYGSAYTDIGKTPTPSPTPTPVSNPTDTSNSLKAAITQPQQTISVPQYAPATDNSGLINGQYSDLISALKSQIQQSINNKNLDINGLPTKYQPQKDTSEVQKANELRSVLEQNANAGDKGGIGRQNALETQTAGDNRLNNINLQQTAEETSLRNDIANLTSEGNAQEAQLRAQQLKDLIANNQYLDSTNYGRSQDQFNNNISLQNLNNSTNSTNANIANTNANTEAQILQNKENSDPNSITNQMKQLGLNTAKINYSILDQTSKAQVDSVLADLKSKNISNDQAQYELDELTNPNSVTNQTKAIDLASKQQDYAQQQKINAEWTQTAPLRLKQAQEQVLQATDASRLAKLQVQVEQEELLAKKIDTSFMNQQQKDKHAQALMDIQDTKSAISNRAAQLGISRDELKERKREFDVTQSNKANPSSKPMTQAQIGNAKTAIAKELEAVNLQKPTQDEINQVFSERYGTPTVTQTNTKSDPQAYAPASQITDPKARQQWYNDNKTEIDKSMNTDQLKVFKTKFGLK